jgi:hypothetical protein
MNPSRGGPALPSTAGPVPRIPKEYAKRRPRKLGINRSNSWAIKIGNNMMTNTLPLPTAAAAPARPVSALAITAFLLSVTPFFLPYDRHASTAFAALALTLSIAFGIAALRRIKKHAQIDQLLAVAGLVISGTWVAYVAFTLVLGVLTRTW